MQSAKTRLGADCGSVSLLTNSDLKKVGKTTRPFRYDLNQIPYDYTLEVRKDLSAGIPIIANASFAGAGLVSMNKALIKSYCL